MENEDSVNAPAEAKLDFLHIKPSTRHQRLFQNLSQFGINSNVITVAASFTNLETKGALLSKAVVYPALRKVARQYPELGVVYLRRQSEKNKKNHRGFSGFLRHIDLDDHVIFRQIPVKDGKEDLTSIMEEYHNLWIDITEKPPWKLVILNGSQALLVFHHYITDGRGATFIINSLAEALNSPDESNDESPVVDLIKVNGFPEEDPINLYGIGPSIIWAIWSFLFLYLVKLFFRGSDFVFHDLKSQKIDFAFDEPIKEENRVTTKLHTLRLDAETMRKCLQACREHQVTFTSLLYGLIQVTLATDFYPKAKMSLSQIVIDTRPIFPDLQGRQNRMNICAAALPMYDWLPESRKAGQTTGENRSLIWSFVQNRHAHMIKDFRKKAPVYVKNSIAIKLLGEDEEDYLSGLFGFVLAQNKGYSISNLGAFESGSSGPWKISHMEFSTGADQAGVGLSLIFNVVGVRDAATVIHASCAKGGLPDDFGSLLLKKVEERLNAVI